MVRTKEKRRERWGTGSCLGKVLKEAVSEKVTSKLTPEGREEGRAVQIRGNGRCKGPGEECAIYSDGERLWEVDLSILDLLH